MHSNCSSDKNEAEPLVPKQNKEDNFTIKKIDSLIFRISVHAPGPISIKESHRIETANPVLLIVDSTQFVKRLKELGLVNGYELQLSKFRTLSEFSLTNQTGDTLNGKSYYFRPDSLYNRTFRISVTNRKDTAYTDIYEGTSLEPIKMTIVDFIPGGFNEIALIKKYYIVNGYNYDIVIYEIK